MWYIMTNHLQEPTGAEMPQDNFQTSDELKNQETQPIALDKADDNDSVPVEGQVSEIVDASDQTNIENETPDVAADKNGVVPVKDEDLVAEADNEVVIDQKIEEDTASDENAVEEHKEPEKTELDYAKFTRKEIVERLRELIDKGDIDTLRREMDAIKFQFYRKLKAEEELKRAEYIENGGTDRKSVV